MKKTALVTGANHGLGLSLTKTFLERGFTVFAGVYKLNVNSLIQEIKDREGLFIVDMDVSDTQSVEKSADYVKETVQSLDILVNNAAILCKDSYDKTNRTVLDSQDFDSMLEAFNVNALGALRVASAFSSILLKGNEKLLINISSEAGSIEDCRRNAWFGYCMSKTAMNMAGTIIQNEYIKHGGKVWQIQPGWMQTYMHGTKYEEATQTPDYTAEQIYKLIEDIDLYESGKAVFMDIYGKPLPW